MQHLKYLTKTLAWHAVYASGNFYQDYAAGTAAHDDMFNSGSPGGTGGHPPPGGGGGQHPFLQPQGSPITGSNLVVRPKPAGSPDECMKRPANVIQNGKLSKEGELKLKSTKELER